MVYETDFYTTRRPYRASPSLSTYTVTSEPSRQVRILPGLGKVHVVHSYDRIIPYIGHKRLHVVTQPPTITVRVRPSTLYREFDRIENKLRPYTYNSYTNDYLNSDSHVRIIYVRNPISGSYPIYRPSTLYTRSYSYYDPNYVTKVLDSSTSYSSLYPVYGTYYLRSLLPPAWRTHYYSPHNLYPSERWLDLSLVPSFRYSHYARAFDDETRSIRAQINALSNEVHRHVPRKLRSMPLPCSPSHCTSLQRYEELPARWSNDNYVHKMVCSTPSNSAEYVTYWSDPVRRQFCNGRLACVNIVGGKMQPRRKNIYTFHDDPVRSDIQLLSYYINRFREERNIKKPISVRVILPPLRPTRVFSVPRPLEDAHMDTEEVSQMKQERKERLAKLAEINPADLPKIDVKAKLAEEKAKREATLTGSAKKAAEKKREEAAAAKAAEEAAAAEEAKKQEAKKAAEEAAAAEAKKAADAEAAKKAAAEEAKAKEEAAKKEKEAKEAAAKAAELERLAEQAKQEELAKQAEIEKAKKEEEERQRLEEEKRAAEAAKAEEERQQLLRLEEIARQAEEEKEAELVRQAEELAELARQEAELAEQAKAEEEAAEQQRKEAEAAELAQKEAELAELETKEKELTEQAEQARAEADVAAEAAEATEPAAESEVEETATEEPIVEEPSSPAPAEESEAVAESTAEEVAEEE